MPARAEEGCGADGAEGSEKLRPGAAEDPPLVVAVKADDVPAIRDILGKKGADIDARSGAFGWTALHIAAGSGVPAACAALLELRADVNSTSDDGETALHIAAQEARQEEVRLLVGARADLAKTNDDGETPLHTAVQHVGGKATGAIEALLELKADPLLRDGDNRSVLEHARVYTNRADELQALLTAASPELQKTIADSSPIAGGHETDAALHTACRRGQVDCVKQFLEWVPDAAAAAQQALVPAAGGGHVDIVELLVEAKADLRSKTFAEDCGTTPLITAADEGHVKMVRWLLQQGASPEATSRDGATALMAAAIRGSCEAAALLLNAQADPNHRAHNAWTALMVACQAGKADVARQLLDARARLDFANGDGSTARDLAVANGQNDLIKLLDTRARLDARREAKAAAKGGGSGASGAGTEDTRDLEALLKSLGETPKPATSSSSAKVSKKAAKKAAGKEEEDGVAAGGATSAVAAAAASPGTTAGVKAVSSQEHSDKSLPAGVSPAASSPQLGPAVPGAAGGAGKKKKEGKQSERAAQQKPPSPEDAKRARELHVRLREVERQKAALDVEEAEIRRQLAECEGVSGSTFSPAARH